MNWQDDAVGAVGLLLAVWLCWRLWCFFSGRRRSGCASCSANRCPLKKLKMKK